MESVVVALTPGPPWFAGRSTVSRNVLLAADRGSNRHVKNVRLRRLSGRGSAMRGSQVEERFARICKRFRNRSLRPAAEGQDGGTADPFRGRLRCAVIDSCLSRRRSRVRVSSAPPILTMQSRHDGGSAQRPAITCVSNLASWRPMP